MPLARLPPEHSHLPRFSGALRPNATIWRGLEHRRGVRKAIASELTLSPNGRHVPCYVYSAVSDLCEVRNGANQLPRDATRESRRATLPLIRTDRTSAAGMRSAAAGDIV
jgi:hypothetical protein